MTRKECMVDDCYNPIWAKKLCKNHQYMRTDAKRPKSLQSNSSISPISERGRKVIKKDNEFYDHMWSIKPHYCRECNCFLGEVWKRIYFSHILSKGAWPQLRHDERNIDILCARHHRQWHGNKQRAMVVFHNNKKLMRDLIRECSTI